MRLHFSEVTAPVARRIRQRLKEEIKARGITQTDLGDALSKLTREFWSQSKVGKVLNGHVGLQLDDLAAICEVIGISLAEAVRDRGLEFYAELTPSEVRIIEELRKDPPAKQFVIDTLHIRQTRVENPAPTPRPRLGRPKNRINPLRSDPDADS